MPISDAWDTSEKKRHLKDRDKDFRGIFIGAFNETKGWNEVKSLILQNQDVFFEVVSKYSSDDHGLPSDIGSNWRVHRQLSQSELAKLALECDFFLLGSGFETQCLAAIECANLGLPILMKETGLLASLPLDDRKKVGVFAANLQVGLLDLVSRLNSELESFAPARILYKYGISAEGLRREWIELILLELENSFQIKEYRINSLKIVIKKLIPSKLKVIIRAFIRK